MNLLEFKIFLKRRLELDFVEKSYTKNTKLDIFNSIIKDVLVYGSEI